jgi:hypothetical protein
MGMGGSHHLSISAAQDLQLMVAGMISHFGANCGHPERSGPLTAQIDKTREHGVKSHAFLATYFLDILDLLARW